MAITGTSDLDINNQSAIADSELGRQLGTIFSTTSSSAMNTMTNNIMKGQALTQGLGQNVGTSLAGAGVGIASNYIGQGITSALGNNYTGRALGAGVSTGLGTVGGKVAGNLITSGKIGNLFSGAGSINPYGLAATVVGSALSAGNGPSKEYAGRYGSTTRTMDTVYDGLTLAVNAIPGWGQLASGLMTLNKGLSNVFGSTSGMTQTDAILGSAFMPAPIKWLNVAGAKTTSNFNNQSWQNMEKADSFMGNAFGNLGERFGDARVEAGKTYGRFSKSAYREAQNNIDFANRAWNQIMQMANQNEIQNIRAQDMSSINNQRYTQNIQGGWSPIARGKQGMKIFNNATNHNIGMRLLSAAALIDNKAMILSAQGGTKVTRPPRMRAHRKGDESRGLTPEEQEWWRQHEEEKKRQQEEETAKKIKEKEEAADKFNQQTSIVMDAITQQANETPFTGQEYQQAAENQRQEKVEKFHEAEKIGEAALMADLAVSAAPLLQKGFRWVFNKAGQLVKVPKQSELFSQNLSSEKFINPDGSINVQEAVPEIVRGKNFAIEYLNSPIRTAVNTHNKELANRLGFKLFRPFNEARQRVSTPSNLKIVRENSSIGGSVSTDSKNPAADQVTINLYNSDPYYASMHENLHRGYLGNAPKEYFLNETRGTFGDTNRFYNYLKDKLLKPWSERYNLPGADYLDQSAELAVNMFEVGQRMGLKVGQKFPGNQKVLELLEKYKNSGDYKSGVIDHLNLKHPLRIWKALTGTLFSVPLIYGTVNNTIGQKAK